MCGRYNNHLPKMHGWSEALKEWPELQNSYNVTPISQVAAFRSGRGGAMRWGMVPTWSNSFDSKFATFNARIESVDEKPTFRNAWAKSQRYIIPMAEYYEWTGIKGNKTPFYITDKDQGCLAVAGLYELWGEDQLSCTILTTAANDELAQIHTRMPVMLTPSEIKSWIHGTPDKGDVLSLEQPNVIYYPVSSVVGNIRNDDPSLIEPCS